MPDSVVDEIFSRRQSPQTVAPMQFTDLGPDELAEVVAQVLQLAEEPRTFEPMLDSSRITHMKRLCNELRTLRLVNAELNRPAVLSPIFAQIAKQMRIDPVEVEHRVGEINGDFLDRIRAVLRARCDFASKMTRIHLTQERQDVRRAAALALWDSDVGGRADVLQTHAERMARCLWYCAYSRNTRSVVEAARCLILAKWDDEMLTLASFKPERLPPNEQLYDGEAVLVVLDEAVEVEAVLRAPFPDAERLRVAYIDKDSGGRKVTSVPRAQVRYPPTETLKALEHLLAGKRKLLVRRIQNADYEQLILTAANENRPSAVEVLVASRAHSLTTSTLRRALAAAVRHNNGRLLIALATRDALARDVYHDGPAYVLPEDMVQAYECARSEEQKRLLYLPAHAEAPNIFYDPAASPQELAAWKQHWKDETDRGVRETVARQ